MSTQIHINQVTIQCPECLWQKGPYTDIAKARRDAKQHDLNEHAEILTTPIQRVRESRKKLNITQSDLAALASAHGSIIGRNTIASAETGRREDYSLAEIKQFAKVLQVDPAYLAGFTN